MRSHGGLWDRVTDAEELYLAYRRARRCKRQSPAMAAFAYDLESQLARLQKELIYGQYRPSGYRCFSVRDPKPRKIYAAAFRDRVVHHSLVAAIEPVFERSMISASYACRRGKGTHAALFALDRCWRGCESKGTAYVLRLDFSKYFFNIEHERLLAVVEPKFRERPVRDLIETIVRSLSTGGRPGMGIPIGNLTSQLFANVYLDVLDHFVKEQLRVRYYLRYMDDLALFANDKESLWKWRDAIAGLAGNRLGLTLNPRRTWLGPARHGVSWLGFRVLEPGMRRLARRNVVRAARRVRKLARAQQREVHESLQAWIAHASYAQTWNLRRSLFGAVAWN